MPTSSASTSATAASPGSRPSPYASGSPAATPTPTSGQRWSPRSSAVAPTVHVRRIQSIGCTEVYATWFHWPCLFPQHGPGRKHERPIVLEPWQAAIALDRYPGRFLRGLIHSDGWRGTNRVRGANGRPYAYPRYQFSNASSDIRALFCAACDRLGVSWRQMNRMNISVARRDSVALLNEHVGPKS